LYVGEKNEGQDFRAGHVEAVRLGDEGEAAVVTELFATAGDVGGETLFEVEHDRDKVVVGG
jgi:hypothetical protein